jgi:hypothetical protein
MLRAALAACCRKTANLGSPFLFGGFGKISSAWKEGRLFFGGDFGRLAAERSASAAIAPPKVCFATQFPRILWLKPQFPAEFGNSCCPFQGSGI